ncbi:MAG TPA: hypothetical protein VF444_01455 [Pseudonocardiaceae bacterium]
MKRCGPLDAAPRGVRPPFDRPTPALLDRQADEYAEGWRERRHAEKVSALLAPLAGIELGAQDRRVIEYLAGDEIPTIGTVASLLYRARAAGDLGA